MAKRVKMTLFAPTNDAVNLPSGLTAMPGSSASLESAMGEMRLEQLGKSVASNHVSVGRVIDPEDLVIGQERRLPAKGHKTEIVMMKDATGAITINGSAKVLQVIHAKNGIIYEIDEVLAPRYNDGPTLEEFIQMDPHLSISHGAMGGSGLMGSYDRLGPITVFLVADSGFVGQDGSPVPQCVMDALRRPENAAAAQKLVAHAIVDGVVRVEDMEQSLSPLYGPPLHVSRVKYVYDPADLSAIASHEDVYVEGRKILHANIPIYNGYAHILDGLIHLSEVDMQGLSYWSCLDDHLRSTPKQVRVVLERVDAHRSLPVLGHPPGPRPAWVGYGLPKYFPPHSTYRSHSRGSRGGLFGGGSGRFGNGATTYSYPTY